MSSLERKHLERKKWVMESFVAGPGQEPRPSYLLQRDVKLEGARLDIPAAYVLRWDQVPECLMGIPLMSKGRHKSRHS